MSSSNEPFPNGGDERKKDTADVPDIDVEGDDHVAREEPSAGLDPLDLDEVDNDAGRGRNQDDADSEDEEEEGGGGGQLKSAGPEVQSGHDTVRRKQLDAEVAQNFRLLQTPVPLAYTLKHIEEQADSRILTRQLALYICFLLVLTLYGFSRRSTSEEHFATAGLWQVLGNHELSPQKYYTGAPLNSGIHYPKMFDDIANPAHWQDWFEDVFIPRFYDSLNRTTRLSKKGPLPTHQLVGGIRIQTYRTLEGVSCEVNHNYYPTESYSRQCWAPFSSSDDRIDKEPITGILDPVTGNNLSIPFVEHCTLPFQDTWGRLHTYPCGGHTFDISANATFDEAMDIARQMRSTNFVNMSNTRFLLVDFITFVEGLDTFVSGKFFVEITTGGGWIPTSRIKAFHLWTDTGKHATTHIASLVLDIVFILFVAYYWLRLLRYFFFGRENPRSLKFFFDLWNLLDLINLVGLVCNIGFHLKGRIVSQDLQEKDNFKLPQTEGYYEELNYIMELYYLEIYFISLNTIIAYLKILMYLRLNNRLNILTRTLASTSHDIIGVLIIFTLLVTSYAATGYVLYGTALIEFHNTSYSFTSLFLMLLGKFDYALMRQEQQTVTFLFFWSYIVLGLFAMLNFITAIIGKGFDEEVAKTVHLPLHAQLRRARKRLLKVKPWQTCATLFSRQRFREDIITDFLVEYRRALLAADNLHMDVINRGEEDEPEYIITRLILGQMIPQQEVDYITDEFLDDLWLELAEDYALATQDDIAKEEERLANAYEDGMSRAFVNVFLSKRAALTAAQNTLLHGKGSDGELLDAAKASSDAVLRRQRELLMDPSAARSARSALQPQLSVRQLSARRGPMSARGDGGDSSLASTRKDGGPVLLTTDEATSALLGENLGDHDEEDPAIVEAIYGIVSRDETKARLQSTQTSGIQNLSIRVKELESAMSTVEMLLNRASHKIVANSNGQSVKNKKK